MKKRIFISMHYMEIGGAEISLIGLLRAIDYSRYDVDLFLHVWRGDLMCFIPKEVNLLPEMKEYSHIECPMTRTFLDGCWRILYGRIKAKLKTLCYLKKKRIKESAAELQFVADCVSPFLPSLDFLGEYDMAISYLHPHNYVIDKVFAKKRACWIHTDYTRVDIDVTRELPIWRAYDYIISISPSVTNSFLAVFPSLHEKVVLMENILSPSFIRQRASEFSAEDEIMGYGHGIRLLSIGRFCDAKNYDNVPDICRRIVVKGVNIRWLLIGYGGDEEIIRRKIKEAGMEKRVFILGKRTNPYPYIKACDIYVQPSRYEGKSVTVREAQILCKPVVVTNYPTASSQIKDGIDGCIVPLDNQGCAEGLFSFIKDINKQNRIVSHLIKNDYGSISEVSRLYQLI